MKKTYFVAWETNNKIGHCIYDFEKDITPRKALNFMIDKIKENLEKDSIGEVRATQFNNVA